MEGNIKYKEQLKKLNEDIQQDFYLKYDIISLFVMKHKLNKIIKLNKKTKNQNIDEILKTVGRLKIKYKKFCEKNNYEKDTDIIDSINNAYIKLSRKSMKIKTRRKTEKNMQIEYNSDKGAYEVSYYKNGIKTSSKEYKVKHMRNLDLKREKVKKELKRQNYGIDVFKELKLDEDKFDKVNPDIIHILLKEGQVDYAKMYIKEVTEGLLLHKPFTIRYVLNRDLKQGRLSFEENKAVKKMAKKDRVSSELVIYDSRKTKKIAKPRVNVFEKIGKVFNSFFKPQPVIQPAFYVNLNSESKMKLENGFIARNRVENNQIYPRLVLNKEGRTVAHGANVR